MITNNPKPIKIKVCKDELQSFNFYLMDICDKKKYFDSVFSLTTRFFLIWHLEEMRSKVLDKIINLYGETGEFKTTLPITKAEQHTMSILFKHFPGDEPYTMIIENKIINGLVCL